MKKILAILFGLIVLSSLVSAQDVLVEIEDTVSMYSGEEMPQPFSMIFGDERINVYIDDYEYSVVTEDGIMKEFNTGLLEDPTMNVYTSVATVEKLMASENVLEDLEKALDDEEIWYEGVGVFKKIKLFFVNMAAGIVSWFI